MSARNIDRTEDSYVLTTRVRGAAYASRGRQSLRATMTREGRYSLDTLSGDRRPYIWRGISDFGLGVGGLGQIRPL